MDNIYELWAAVLQELTGQVSTAVMSTWIKTLVPVSFDDDCLVLETSSDFKKNIIDRRFTQDIKKATENILGFDITVKIVVDEQVSRIQEKTAQDASSSPVQTPVGREIDAKNFEPTFSNFIVGSTNQFAYVAAVAVTNNPGSVHNPLFIYGESGLGKTHLLKAIRAELKRTRPNMNILYTSGENFLNEMINHMGEKNMGEFHNKYRNADILLMDDIQFIGKTSVAQEEFFYTFEALINQGKQIVLTSDRPPKDIPTLEERLRSRFVQGLLADIQPPMLETRIAIIRRKAQAFEMNIPDDVIEFIAERLKNNVRQIEGVVNKMYAVYSIDGNSPTIGVANDIIKDIIYYAQPTEVTINNIIDKVATSFGVSPEDIRSEKKKAEISNARQFAMYIMREVTNLTYEEIGAQFGGKKHSTVIYSIEASESKMEDNPQLKTTVYDIMKSIKDERNE
ncbi:MAG: chromosomal replication initiator protein DnaA [Clostridia bacterium]|nr:chromosomal replication initiator protein DnaA [Clostridia bacterium]